MNIYGHPVSTVLIVMGGACALGLRALRPGTMRGWIKLAAFVLIGISLGWEGVNDYREELTRTITPVSVEGTMVQLHSEPQGRGQAQHFKLLFGDGEFTRDLYSNEGLMFVVAKDGQEVQATYTKESGYVSEFHIVAGPKGGYAYSEPDQRNFLGGGFFVLVGFVLVMTGVIQRFSNPRADPALEGP